MKIYLAKLTINLFLFLSVIYNATAQIHPELGNVKWLRDYSFALEESIKKDKPILILFQEIPGCSTCVNYGKNVLSNPLLVDAIENEFIPLAIFNNHKGKDKKVLNKYNEPSWNNPVSRIVNEEGEDIVNRLSGNYSELGLSSYLIEGLRKHGTDPPLYLQLLNQELEAKSKRQTRAYYQMYCFWSGEAHLGNIDGIVSTVPGFMNGAEVVEVNYDESRLQKGQLTNHAKKANCLPVKHVGAFKKDKDLQYYLKNSKYKYLPLTALQRTKINTALANNKGPDLYLSPKQKSMLLTAKKGDKVLYDMGFKMAWNSQKK